MHFPALLPPMITKTKKGFEGSIKSLQATRDSAFSLSRSRWLADVTEPACLSSGR